jgi:hypothetical protein
MSSSLLKRHGFSPDFCRVVACRDYTIIREHRVAVAARDDPTTDGGGRLCKTHNFSVDLCRKKTSFPPNFNNKTTSVVVEYITHTNLITSLKIGCDYVRNQYKILSTKCCGMTRRISAAMKRSST